MQIITQKIALNICNIEIKSRNFKWKNELKNNEKNMVKIDVMNYMINAILDLIGIIGKYA